MDLLDLTDKQLEIFDSVLSEYPKLKVLELRDILKKEQSRRSLPELSRTEIISKFLLRYIKFEFGDGLGSYEVWKVKRIDDLGNKTYILYPEKPIVSNVDGMYSIDAYLDEVTIETNEDLKKFTVISKEEYDSEFSKAIEYFMSLKKD